MLDDRPDLVTWRHGRCLPYGEGITFWALGEIVKAEAGILGVGRRGRCACQARGERRRDVPGRGRGDMVGGAARPARRRGDRRRHGEPRGVVHRVASFPRGAGGAAAVRPRRRGPALGRRSLVGLPGAPPRLERAGAAPAPVHCETRALRAADGVGRRKAQRHDDLALAADQGRCEPAPAGVARAERAPGRDADALARAGGRKPVVRRAVCPHARRAGRRRGGRRPRDRARARRRRGSTRCDRSSSRCSTTLPSSAACSGSAPSPPSEDETATRCAAT